MICSYISSYTFSKIFRCHTDLFFVRFLRIYWCPNSKNNKFVACNSSSSMISQKLLHAHNCSQLNVNRPRHTNIHNRSQLFPTNVNTPMCTTVHNYSRLFTTVHNSMWTSLNCGVQTSLTTLTTNTTNADDVAPAMHC